MTLIAIFSLLAMTTAPVDNEALSTVEMNIPAKPATIVGGIISDRDYPESALRAREEGVVVMRYLVSEQGRVSVCEITASSTSHALDQKSCQIMKRFRFKPARDASGSSVPQILEQAIAWTISGRCPELGPQAICISRPDRKD